MKDKHAYLILAHNQFEILSYLIRCLDYPKNDIFIHIDKKVSKFDFKAFASLAKKSHVFFVENRIDVRWGTYSLVQAELELFKFAYVKGGYRYYHMMSGVDLPLKNQKIIHDFFVKHDGKEFVHFDAESIAPVYLNRAKKYYFFVHRKNLLPVKLLQGVFSCFQLFVDRTKNTGLTYQKGSQWLSITDELCDYILRNEELVKKAFRWTKTPDESFVQSLVYSSKYRDSIYKVPAGAVDSNDSSANLYCIDWKRGQPYEFMTEDFDMLMSSGMLFARKFNWKKDYEIIKKIADAVLNS